MECNVTSAISTVFVDTSLLRYRDPLTVQFSAMGLLNILS